jgi:hypothetical protein
MRIVVLSTSRRERVRLLDHHFIREQKGRGVVGKLDQVHLSAKVAYLPQNPRMLSETRASIVVAHGFE